MGNSARKVEVGSGRKSTPKSRRSGYKPDLAAMTIVAGNRGQVDDNFLRFLESNPELALELGSALKKSRAKFASAYPGETRETTFTNAEWRAGGYDYFAAVNNAMGLKES